jgi:hypothetical protein
MRCELGHAVGALSRSLEGRCSDRVGGVTRGHHRRARAVASFTAPRNASPAKRGGRLRVSAPLTDTVATTIGRFVDDAGATREPSHSALEFHHKLARGRDATGRAPLTALARRGCPCSAPNG